MSTNTNPIRAAVLTVSDRCSRGQAVDTSGPGLCEILRAQMNAVIVATRCLPDEEELTAEIERTQALLLERRKGIALGIGGAHTHESTRKEHKSGGRKRGTKSTKGG